MPSSFAEMDSAVIVEKLKMTSSFFLRLRWNTCDFYSYVRNHISQNYLNGRDVWESNPPGTPMRRPPTVLKTATSTG